MEHLLAVLSKIYMSMRTPIGWMCAVGSYFLPLRGIYELMLGIVVVDFITGMVASHVKKVPRSSRRLRKSVWKLLSYVSIVWLFYKAETELSVEWISSYKWIAGFIFVTEVISILENMSVATENKVFINIIKVIRGHAKETNSTISEILEEKNETKKDTEK